MSSKSIMAGEEPTAINNVSNAAEFHVEMSKPYRVEVTIQGIAPILFHRFNCDDVQAKASAAKNSAQKKTDNLESYVYRNEEGEICIPGIYLIGSIINKRNGAAKYLPDPRSPRKSALDLFQAGVFSETILASIGKKDWEYIDRQRAIVAQSAILRLRPAFLPGWKATFILQCVTPEYIPPQLLLHTLTNAGRLVGIADQRPTFGRFQVIKYEMLDEENPPIAIK